MTEELKPCPFCASTNLVIEHLEGTVLYPAYRVRCDHCDCSSRYTDVFHVKAWNTRHHDPEILQDVRELREKCDNYTSCIDGVINSADKLNLTEEVDIMVLEKESVKQLLNKTSKWEK